MIRLPPDCLAFETPGGEPVPGLHAEICLELIGDAAEFLDEDLIRNAAQAVVHYFKSELGRTAVSLGEFSQALKQALRALGLEVASLEAFDVSSRVAEADLGRLARESGEGFELVFFGRLRGELRRRLDQSPRVLRFRGLRDCVKRLAGAKRWSARCHDLNDQIVEYLRNCLSAEPKGSSCALVVH